MSLRGHLLVASARMADPNFSQAVILLLRHDETGAYGVILNRPTDRPARELWRRMRGSPCRSDRTIDEGGPVPGPLVALHAEADLGEDEVMAGVWCSMSGERLERLVDRAPDALRLFAGYSGWGAGQLDGELQRGVWLTTEAVPSDVFSARADGLWSAAHRRAAGWAEGSFADDVDPRVN